MCYINLKYVIFFIVYVLSIALFVGDYTQVLWLSMYVKGIPYDVLLKLYVIVPDSTGLNVRAEWGLECKLYVIEDFYSL